jgi:cystathionine beta-synthase
LKNIKTREFDNDDEIYPYRIEGLGKFNSICNVFDIIDKFMKVTDEESAHAREKL